MTEKKKMSVAEILAAARKGNTATPPAAAAGSEPEAAAPAAEQSPESQPAAAEAKPAAAPKPAAKPAAAGGARPSVADILAAARAGKGADAAAATPAEAEKPKPAPKPAAEKPAAKPVAAAAKPAGPVEKDTGSILAAARGEKKPGPITKAEAAAMGRPVAPAKDAPGAKPKLVAPPPPVKPDYAKRKDPKQASTEERRTFFAATLGVFLGSSLAIGFTSLFLTSLAWLLGTARFMFPNILTEPPSTFKVGPPSDFPPGAVSDKFKAQFGVWVVNGEYNGQPQIYALRTVCTHLGCTPNWLEGEQKFKCPCHGSGFYKDGINFEGPAPRPLERFSIRLADDGQLEVSKSKTFQEEMGAWADPSCFVPV